MPARVPLDVDLEDKLIYGLTPMRMAYVALALLAAFAIWSSPWAPVPVRALGALFVAAMGALLGWGRWKGRPADSWVIDVSLFMIRTHEIHWNASWLRLRGRRRQHEALAVISPEPVIAAA